MAVYGGSVHGFMDWSESGTLQDLWQSNALCISESWRYTANCITMHEVIDSNVLTSFVLADNIYSTGKACAVFTGQDCY